MVKNVFQHTAVQRAAAGLALFAILLILVAPLISVALQKDPLSAMPGMHHEMSMPMHNHDLTSQPDSHQPDSSHSLPVDHGEACGYCVLLAHVPGLIFLIVLLVSGHVARIRQAIRRQRVRHWIFFPWLCPDTRAPPQICFS